jgi:hypothetical protein
MRDSLVRTLLVVSLLVASGCGDGVDIYSVVQETNTPDDETCTGLAYSYQRMIARTCRVGEVPVHVCATAPLCPAQVDAIMASVARCDAHGQRWSLAELPDCR